MQGRVVGEDYMRGCGRAAECAKIDAAGRGRRDMKMQVEMPEKKERIVRMKIVSKEVRAMASSDVERSKKSVPLWLSAAS